MIINTAFFSFMGLLFILSSIFLILAIYTADIILFVIASLFALAGFISNLVRKEQLLDPFHNSKKT